MSAAWTERDWCAFEQKTAQSVRAGTSSAKSWSALARAARCILQRYSTSFFIVTRFLPRAKRERVEVIYAAVRFPDEVVDTFPLSSEERFARLDAWEADYDKGREKGFRDAAEAGANCFAAGFGEIVQGYRIPKEHYRAFLDAMRLDVQPRRFENLADLIDNYVHGSAVVVGYFLAYVYGASEPRKFSQALEASRDLGIALQLTNFVRDVAEDRQRGRIYLPLDSMQGAQHFSRNSSEADVFGIRNLSRIAEEHYARAEQQLSAFAPDCRVAIQACIDVYRQLNTRVGNKQSGLEQRESVPMAEKLRALPPSKYWRLPLAYLGAI